MLRTHWFRFIENASWGISLGISAETEHRSSVPVAAIKASERIYLVNETKSIKQEELQYLLSGLRSVAREIGDRVNESAYIIIYVKELEFALTDFQPEGLYCAIREWAALEFNFEISKTVIRFDKSANQYVFDITL